MRRQKKNPPSPKTETKRNVVKEIADAVLDSVVGGCGVRIFCNGRVEEN